MTKNSNKQSVKEIYQQRRDKFSLSLDQITRKIRQVSMLRISVFLAGLMAIYLGTTISVWMVVVFALVFFIAFIAIIIWHTKLHNRREELVRLLKINEDELLALENRFAQFHSGVEFLDPDHPFAGDLDIFGEGSIFQYLNRTSTFIGKIKLAGWFLNPEKDIETIKSRQESVADLKTRLEWRQNFQSVGMWLSEAQDDKTGLMAWVKKPADFDKPIFTILLWLMPFLSAFMVYMVAAGGWPSQLFMIYMMIPLFIAFNQVKKVGEKHEQVSRKTGLLKKYSRLFEAIEAEDFSTPSLKTHQQNLINGGESASKAIHKLYKIVNALDSRLNIFGWIFLNYFLLWDILQSRRLDRWREIYKDDLEKWFETLSCFDALNSLACFSFNNPGFIFPEPVDTAFVLKAEDCGHPLILEDSRINNPIGLEGWKQFIIVTGANMAGKSTYLRTVAVNFILAMTGAPVCASKFIFSPAEIFTSIRTRDNLLQNESYFFAELKRLKAIIDELERGKQLFIILDEILKGTNSKDKQMGSLALLKQLIRYNATGLIATHDLSLGSLIDEFPENIRNKRFEVEIENDNLVFDYTLKDGISRNLNATFLMKKMGITI
jgi:ABC-type multidrug transport system fused ATPase/permease subunit